jgi:phosphopantothenoylcysteine decarboxylase/phosphopantothenate--cysteine ligase
LARAAGGPLQGRRVLLGVCGGIAAYKAVEVCRRLSDAGALVVPVLTEGATRFVAPLTFSALAAEPARTSLFGPDGAGDPLTPVPHVALGRGIDAVVVAPATARLIGSYAAGISSDLLTATLLATRAPVLVCPAMHAEMWEHPAVQDNVALLRRRGAHVLEPVAGRLAGGDFGRGRLPEPEEIVAALAGVLGPRLGPRSGPLEGVTAVVTAGGTREALDPVRYIANRSSGKQGYAIAAELVARGATVTLITSSPLAPPVGTDVVEVESAAEMEQAVLAADATADVVVMAAAVADFRPAIVADRKLKKTGAPMSLALVPTPDILAGLCARRRPGQVLVGFAAETASGDELIALGRAKLATKGPDLMVANDVGAAGVGFGEDVSRAVILSGQSAADLGLVTKGVVAAKLVDAITDLLARATGRQTPQEGTD